MKKGLIALSLLMASNATAQTCIPKPDCADMGYTETSCNGGALKCPFDTTKLFCTSSLPPAVECDVGMIYTSTGECFKAGEERGIVIGIVVLADTIVMSPFVTMIWSANDFMIDVIAGINNDATVANDMQGKSNSTALVPVLESKGETVSSSAVLYCNSYAPSGTSAGDWYLPAMGELYHYVAANYSKLYDAIVHLNLYNGGYYYFWSSTNTASANGAWLLSFSVSRNYQTNLYEPQTINKYRMGRDYDDVDVSCFLDISKN